MNAAAEGPFRYRLLPVVMRGLLVVVGVLPWIVAPLRRVATLDELGAVLDLVFLSMCHRIPARTLAFAGVPMPLCSRCAGIFAGIALGALIARPRLTMKAWRPILAASGALMVIEVVTQDLGVHPVFHPTRIATGVALGYAMAAAFATNLLQKPTAHDPAAKKLP